MSSRSNKSLCLFAFIVCLQMMPASIVSAAPAVPDSFEATQALIKPHAGESLWMQVPWLTSVWDARQRAAVEGKPLFIWAGSGGGPIGIC